MAQDGVQFIFYFEIEYMTSRTIKRDTNSGVGETKCIKKHLSLSTTQPQKSASNTSLLSALAERGCSVKIRGGSAICLCQSYLCKTRRFRVISRRFRDLQLTVTVSDLRGIYSPVCLNGHFALLCNSDRLPTLSPALTLALTILHPNLSKSFEGLVNSCEFELEKSSSCVLVYLVEP